MAAVGHGAESLGAQFRPIDEWPKRETADRQPSRFRASWGSTVKLLRQELNALDARNVEVRMDMPHTRIRNDGFPYVNAIPESPRFLLAFDTPGRDRLVFACDQWDRWEDNARAVALTMENLRAVDRYGVTSGREQYQGFKALPPQGGVSTTMTAEAAASLVAKLSGHYTASDLTRLKEVVAPACRLAARKVHPDTGGTAAAFQNLQVAREVLERHHGLRK